MTCTEAICTPYGGYWNVAQRTISQLAPAGWYSFQAIFGSIYPILGIAALIVLLRLKRPNKVHILLFGMIVWCCVIRTLWLWLDPFNTRRIIPPMVDQILYGNGLWSLLAVFIIILGLWYYIYVKTKYLGNVETREKHAKYSVIVLVGVILLFLVTNTTLDVFRAVPQTVSTRIIILGLYFLNISIFVGIPGILYFALGRKLEHELNKFISLNGMQVQDGYIRKITILTTSSCILAFSTLLILVAIFIVLYILSEKNKLTPSMALGFHVIYRTLEISYILTVLGIFFFKVSPKLASSSYVRMR